MHCRSGKGEEARADATILNSENPMIDHDTVSAVISNRWHVMSDYAHESDRRCLSGGNAQGECNREKTLTTRQEADEPGG